MTNFFALVGFMAVWCGIALVVWNGCNLYFEYKKLIDRVAHLEEWVAHQPWKKDHGDEPQGL